MKLASKAYEKHVKMKSHQKYSKNDIKIYTSVRIKDHERKERAATP
jgi:hypothetical protein